MLNTWGDAVLVNQPIKCWLLVDFEGLLYEVGSCMALGWLNFWRFWVKCWDFIKTCCYGILFLLIGVRFAFGRLATQAGEPADRAAAGAQHHPHGDYAEVLHCTNNHAVMHVYTSLTCIQTNFLACTP